MSRIPSHNVGNPYVLVVALLLLLLLLLVRHFLLKFLLLRFRYHSKLGLNSAQRERPFVRSPRRKTSRASCSEIVDSGPSEEPY